MTLPVPDATTGSRDEPSILPAPGTDPEWYKRAVFYEVLIRGFHDSNGDGTGDIRGLTEKLDYLHWLGVDCIWLLPIYESPLRDGGYDISDFLKVLPEFGDLGDFVELVRTARSRGIRVIVDFVMNHTSDQHPWFRSARRSVASAAFGSPTSAWAAASASRQTASRNAVAWHACVASSTARSPKRAVGSVASSNATAAVWRGHPGSACTSAAYCASASALRPWRSRV